MEEMEIREGQKNSYQKIRQNKSYIYRSNSGKETKI